MIVHQRTGFNLEDTLVFVSINVLLDYLYYDMSQFLHYVKDEITIHLVI